MILSTNCFASIQFSTAPSTEVRDEGTKQGDVITFNYTGAGVSAVVTGDTATVTITGGGGGSGTTENTFETIDVPAGTDPVAESATDTLTITETSPLVITGTAGTDTLNITWETLTVAEGGTGATTLTDGGLLLGSGTGAITPLGVAANGQIPIGDWTTDPVLATITGTADEITVTNGAGAITLDIPDPLIVGKGGTGAATLTDGGILLGSGTGAITPLGVATNGQIPIGDGTTDPVLATVTGTANELTVTNGAGSITLDLPLNAGTDITADLEEEVTSGSLADNVITDAELATTESLNLPVYSAKLTGVFVVRTPTSGDASTQGAQIDAGDGNWRLLFDPTTDEAAVWQFRLPDYWAAHSELNIFYTMTSATAAEVEFEADVMCVSDGDADDVGTAGFVGVAVGSATVPGTAGFPDEISITLTDDACAAGDMMWLYLSTDANH